MVSLLYFGLALILGALQALSFSPTPYGFLQMVSLAGLLALLRISRQPAWLTLVFCLSWFSVGMYWLHFSISGVGGLPMVVSVAAIVALALCLGAFYAVLMGQWARWRRGAASEALALCVGFPLFWLAAELARGYVFFGGFPWLATGYAHVDNPLLRGWYPVVGVYGVGLLSAFFAAALLTFALVFLKKFHFRDAGDKNRTVALVGGISVSLAVLGLILQGVTWGKDAGSPILVNIVQPNVSQDLKFDRDIMVKNTHAFLQQATSSTANLTIFPETAIPFLWTDLPDEPLAAVQQSLTSQRAVLIGSVGVDAKGYYNSGMWLDSVSDMRNPKRYDKIHLLPMGETIPFGFKWLIDAMKIPLGGYQAGTEFKPFELKTGTGTVKVEANICYENAFGEELIKAWKNGDEHSPNVWVNMTNLGWFGPASASTNQAQHLAMSRVRAMEMARPMLVVTNTGPSASIDAMGQVVNALPADSATQLTVSVQPHQGLTLYTALGNAPLIALVSLAFGVMIFRRHRQVDI